MALRMSFIMLFVVMAGVNSALAQNWSFDARKIALGSPTGGENLASRMIEEAREYRTLVLPFGLIQVLRDFDRLNPSNDEFDLVRTIEYAAAPIHFTFARDRGDSKADDFISDIGNAELSRDLNGYKGFIPVNQPAAAGLAAPNWGKTFRVREGSDGSFHGGGEYRLGTIDVRGGGVYSRELWNPSAGVGLNMTPRTSLDVALYANSANVERKRNPAIAVSFRFNQ